MATKIYGSGDDAIIFEGTGVVPTEFVAEEETQYMVLSNGLILKFQFIDAVWEIQPINGEEIGMDFQITPASHQQDIESDVFQTDEDVEWVVFGNSFKRTIE